MGTPISAIQLCLSPCGRPNGFPFLATFSRKMRFFPSSLFSLTRVLLNSVMYPTWSMKTGQTETQALHIVQAQSSVSLMTPLVKTSPPADLMSLPRSWTTTLGERSLPLA